MIIANGGNPIIPPIPGIERETVHIASEFLVDAGPAGDRIVVIGGGLLGCETATWLAGQGKKVTLVEKLDELMAAGVPIPLLNKNMLLDMLRFNKVETITGFGVTGVTDQGVTMTDASGKEKSIDADTVILSVGFEPDRSLYDALRQSRMVRHLIGDARKPRNIMGAIWDAYEVARAL